MSKIYVGDELISTKEASELSVASTADTGAPWNIPYIDGGGVGSLGAADEAQALAVAAGLTAAADGGAGVLSFKFATDSTARSTQSGSFVNTGLELAFTPVAADSLLVVRWVTDSSNAWVTGSATGNRSVGARITQDGSAIATARLGRDMTVNQVALPSRPMVALQAVVSAGSTTSRTYRCQIREFAGASRTRTTVNLSMTGVLSVTEISSDVL